MAERTSQESFEDEPRDEEEGEEDPAPLSQQQQASSSRGSEPTLKSGPSHGPLVNSQYLPFFRTRGQLLTKGSSLQPEVGSDQGGVGSTREESSWEDSEPPGGLFPYYRSKEESFPSLSYRASEDLPTRREAPAGAGCFHKTAISESSAASGPSPICCTILLVSAGHSHDHSLDTTFSSNAAFSGHTLRDSGFVPYYRTPEEKLHTSSGGQEVQPHRKDPKTPAAARVEHPAPADQ